MSKKDLSEAKNLLDVLKWSRSEIISVLVEFGYPQMIDTIVQVLDRPMKKAQELCQDHFLNVTKMDEPIKIAEDAIDPPPYHPKWAWEDLYSDSDKIECDFKDLEPGSPFESNGCRYVKIYPLNHKNRKCEARRIQDDGDLAPYNSDLGFFEPNEKVLVLKQHLNGEEGGSLKFSELKEGERFSWECELFERIPLITLHPCFGNGPFIQIPTPVNAVRIDSAGDKSDSLIDYVFFKDDERMTVYPTFSCHR